MLHELLKSGTLRRFGRVEHKTFQDTNSDSDTSDVLGVEPNVTYETSPLFALSWDDFPPHLDCLTTANLGCLMKPGVRNGTNLTNLTSLSCTHDQLNTAPLAGLTAVRTLGLAAFDDGEVVTEQSWHNKLQFFKSLTVRASRL